MSTSTSATSTASSAVSLTPVRLGHAVIKMRDLEQAKRFYVDLLGFELANTYPNMIFFRLGRDHHTLAVLKVDPDAAPPT
ncbi:MAG TPA: VOC family protein, partial [Dehalococcoidia bacterium]|nr:VOC family protein [Dehalococcoidia bacterium]